jgi:hypothetical protein
MKTFKEFCESYLEESVEYGIYSGAYIELKNGDLIKTKTGIRGSCGAKIVKNGDKISAYYSDIPVEDFRKNREGFIYSPNKQYDNIEIKLEESFETDYKKFIAYHQTSKRNAEKILKTGFNFNTSLQKIIWFTNNIEGLKENTLGSSDTETILKLEVTTKKVADWDLYDSKHLDELQQFGYDGVILKESDGTFDGFVFSPKQLKVLGIVDVKDL